MKKTALAVILTSTILLLMISNAQVTNVAIANFSPFTVFLPEIVIKSNGSVIPETGLIVHTGNIYTLAHDVSNYSIVIQCSNITLDGKGHVLNGSQPSPYMIYNTGLSLDFVTNVTVKDLEIAGFNDYEYIRLRNCSECSILRVKTSSVILQNGHLNTIAESVINFSVDMENSQNNTVVKNIIGRLTLGVSHNTLVTENNITSIVVQFCDLNRYFRNNFLSADNSFQYYFSNKESFWDNGSIGNYWSDYITRYPNASEIGRSGIWNIPYEINQVQSAWINGELVNVTWILGYVIDHYPMVAPVDCFAPSIKILSITDRLYETSTIALYFTINEPASHIAYSLDGEEDITITGNLTLTGLANGIHRIVIHVRDEAGNVGSSDTINFTIAEPFPIVPAAASIATVAIVCLGLLVYLKKRQKTKNA